MTGQTLEAAFLGSLFLTGLAGSLHCLAMCGPLLLAFSEAVVGGESRRPGVWRRTLDSLLYHGGRIWTYALLGFAAGWAGSQMRLGAAVVGWQRPLSIAAAAIIVLAGLAALGVLPGGRLGLSLPAGCVSTLQRWPWLAGLIRARQPVARFLLGAVMGLLPCGLVYAVLVVVMTLPSPLHSALGMLCFGAGTLPALTALVAGSGALPGWLRARSPRLAAVLLVGVGLLALARSLLMSPGGAGHGPMP